MYYSMLVAMASWLPSKFILSTMGWLYSFGGECNFGMHRLGGGCGRYILLPGARHILFWGIYVVNGLGYFTIDILLVGEDCSVHICGPPTPEHYCKTVLTPRGRRSWQQHLDVFTASIVFRGVGRVVLFSYYKSILLCILLCFILTISPCSFSHLVIAFAQIHSPSFHRLLPAAIILLAEQILVSTLYCLPKTFIVRSVGGLSCFICAQELRQLSAWLR